METENQAALAAQRLARTIDRPNPYYESLMRSAQAIEKAATADPDKFDIPLIPHEVGYTDRLAEELNKLLHDDQFWLNDPEREPNFRQNPDDPFSGKIITTVYTTAYTGIYQLIITKTAYSTDDFCTMPYQTEQRLVGVEALEKYFPPSQPQLPSSSQQS